MITLDTFIRIAFLTGTILWCAAGIQGMRKAKPDPNEYTPEAPAIPKPIRKAMAVKDRLAKDQGLRERRAKWAVAQEVDRMCQDIAEGRNP